MMANVEKSSEESSRISRILDAIIQHVDSSELKLILSRCPAADVKSWKDDNSLDFVHYCILHNNIVALMLLLTQGFFKTSYEPSTWPYLHLVACLGRRSFISSIIQEVKYQNDTVFLDWDIFNIAIKPRIKMSVPDFVNVDKEKKLSPVDVAAMFGHIGCVRLLLDFWQAQRLSINNKRANNPDSLYLSLACQANSSCALQLLVGEHSDKKEALEYALRMLSPDCVDAVLKDLSSTDVQKAFHGMSLYHVLYSYISCLRHEHYEAMVKITSILIKHNQDVNTLHPSRTFPLYSLLSHTMPSISAEKCSPSLFACLLLLLQAGADPNLDEISIESTIEDPEHNTAFGRRPHSSAINCFLGNILFMKSPACDNPSEVDPLDNYACEVIEVLLRYGADMAFTGKFHMIDYYEMQTATYHFGTALHLILSNRAQSQLNYPLLCLMLRNGIDADTRGTWNIPGSAFTLQYALNILPFSLWSQPVVKYVLTARDFEIFAYIIKFMSQSALVLAYREFLEGVQILRQLAKGLDRLQALEKVHLQESGIFAEIVNEYEIGTRQPWLLQRCCSHVVWRACKMRVGNVNDLPIPGPLKNILIRFH